MFNIINRANNGSNRHIYAWVIMLASVLMLSQMTIASGFVTVGLHDKVQVEGAEIRLGDIAEISSDTPEQVRKLRGLIIAKSPPPNKTRRIRADYIMLRLRQLGIDPAKTLLNGPREVLVSGSYFEIEASEIRNIISDHVASARWWGDARVTIKDIQISLDRMLPKGVVTYRIDPPKIHSKSGIVPIFINFFVDGRFEKKIRATVKLQVFVDVVVTRKPIGRYKPLSAEDLQLKKMDLTNLPSNAITSLEEAIGKRARRNILANVALRPDLIEYPPLVRRGDMVLIVAESEGLKITALGEVKSSGRRGARVKVVNLDTNKRVFARVVDKNTVKVEF